MDKNNNLKVDLPDTTEDAEIVVLTDDEGKDVEFEVAAGIDYQDGYYMVLVPKEKYDGIEEDEAIIFRVEEDENDPEYITYVPVEDESLLDALFAEYLKAVEAEEADYSGFEAKE